MPIRVLTALLLCFALLSLAPSDLGAEEQAPEDSAAARLFRDAWWKETGARDLAGAEKGYGEATAAEGSEAVRARSLYRLGVVQQRQGRTAEAKATLAQLPSRFPSQSWWLDKARKLSASWSTESVETSFSEWYQRHRYGPEFQKKILDLVLQLATTKREAKGAREELLIIGDAALPALQAHAGNRNVQLSASCIEMILELGAFPSAESLIWRTWPAHKSMYRLLGAGGEARRRLQAEFRALASDGTRSPLMRARARDIVDMFDGPMAILNRALASTEEGDNPNSQAMDWAASEGTEQRPIREWMVRKAEDTNANKSAREWLLGNYIDPDWEEVGLPRVRRWLETSKDDLLQQYARSLLSDGDRGGPEAWRLRLPAMRTASKNEDGGREAVFELVWALASCPAEQDLTDVIEVLRAHAVKQHVFDAFKRVRYSLNRETAATRVLESLIRSATGGEALGLSGTWEEAHKKQKPTARMRAVWGDWAANAAHPDVRVLGTRGLARAGGLSAEEIVRYMPGPEAPTPVRDAFFDALARNEDLAELDWDRVGLRALLRALDVPGGGAAPTNYSETWAGWPNRGAAARQYSGKWGLGPRSAGAVFARLVTKPAILRMLQAEALESPTKVPRTFFQVVHPRLLAGASVPEDALATAVARWPQQDDAHRNALLEHLRDGVVPEKQDALVVGVVRKSLPGLRGVSLSRLFRYRLLRYLEPHLTLDDARALFDLSDPKQAMLIIDYAKQFEHTPALLEAFSSLLSKEAPEGAHNAYYRAFRSAFQPDGEVPAFATPFIEAALAHGGDTEGEQGVELLGTRLTTEDEALWLRALAHKRAAVRMEAAAWLGRVYNRAIIASLVEHMDDPNPDVRDAVMKSLAAIEKAEEQKARWRAKAKDWVKEPAAGK